MPVGGFAVASSGTEFEAKITPVVIISCMMAATGGLMFGYDIGVSGNFFFFIVQLEYEILKLIHPLSVVN